MSRLATFAIFALALSSAACSRPELPATDQPPEPQAQTTPAEQHTELRDAIREPLDQAKEAERTMDDAADKQQAAIDAQTGG